MGKFYSTKTYGNEQGLSCCFRQWKAVHSHCSLLHGYSIGVKLTFECDTLDDRNWVMDFGGLREVKSFLKNTFDHTVVVAKDDPELGKFEDLNKSGIINLRVVEAVGCEKFAELIFTECSKIIRKNNLNPSVRMSEVEVFEHGANSAIYKE